MSWYGGYGYGGYYKQPTMAELKQKARVSSTQLERRGHTLSPVVVEGRTIARTWWGKAWVSNLERYADFSNRVGRGKRYVRAGCVIDLQVHGSRIDAVVQGSRKKPYDVSVYIAPMEEGDFAALLERCSARADSLEALVAGDFPQEMKDQLTAGRDGIFPAPTQIRFDCSCPDSARMCKHIAAAIMAVAPQLDTNPLLLFELRGIDTQDLVKRSVEQKLDLMLSNADTPSPRILDVSDDELTRLFGVL
ncbi:MAG: hypothetical protein IKF78_10765 [Atopobiaceae bacterium]|nr:hypothetical protein [Atopobiaceae bacterium]